MDVDVKMYSGEWNDLFVCESRDVQRSCGKSDFHQQHLLATHKATTTQMPAASTMQTTSKCFPSAGCDLKLINWKLVCTFPD